MFSLFDRIVQVFSPEFFKVLKRGDRVHRSGGCRFSGACPNFCLSPEIYLISILNITSPFPVDNRHTAHVEKKTNGMLCLYAHYREKKSLLLERFKKLEKKYVGGF